MAQLLAGCGHRRDKLMGREGFEAWDGLVTLDLTPETGADVVHDLEVFPYPFEDGAFEEIHLYEVLEHTGKQGDWRFFFRQFDELYRILEPGGYVFATCPSMFSPWLWGDPGHTRAITPECLIFLDRSRYDCENTPMTDYRPYFKADFEVCGGSEDKDSFRFILRKRPHG